MLFYYVKFYGHVLKRWTCKILLQNQFTNIMMIYIENTWLTLDLKVWNMLEFKGRKIIKQKFIITRQDKWRKMNARLWPVIVSSCPGGYSGYNYPSGRVEENVL